MWKPLSCPQIHSKMPWGSTHCLESHLPFEPPLQHNACLLWPLSQDEDDSRGRLTDIICQESTPPSVGCAVQTKTSCIRLILDLGQSDEMSEIVWETVWVFSPLLRHTLFPTLVEAVPQGFVVVGYLQLCVTVWGTGAYWVNTTSRCLDQSPFLVEAQGCMLTPDTPGDWSC